MASDQRRCPLVDGDPRGLEMDAARDSPQLTVDVVAPAGDSAITLTTTGVIEARRDLDHRLELRKVEPARGLLPVGVVVPALDRARLVERAERGVASGDLDDGVAQLGHLLGRLGLVADGDRLAVGTPLRVGSTDPAGHSTNLAERAVVVRARGQHRHLAEARDLGQVERRRRARAPVVQEPEAADVAAVVGDAGPHVASRDLDRVGLVLADVLALGHRAATEQLGLAGRTLDRAARRLPGRDVADVGRAGRDHEIRLRAAVPVPGPTRELTVGREVARLPAGGHRRELLDRRRDLGGRRAGRDPEALQHVATPAAQLVVLIDRAGGSLAGRERARLQVRQRVDVDLFVADRLAAIEAPTLDVGLGQGTGEVLGDREPTRVLQVLDGDRGLPGLGGAIAELAVDVATPALDAAVRSPRAGVRVAGVELDRTDEIGDLAHRHLFAAQDREDVAIAAHDLAIGPQHAQVAPRDRDVGRSAKASDLEQVGGHFLGRRRRWRRGPRAGHVPLRGVLARVRDLLTPAGDVAHARQAARERVVDRQRDRTVHSLARHAEVRGREAPDRAVFEQRTRLAVADHDVDRVAQRGHVEDMVAAPHHRAPAANPAVFDDRTDS